MVFIRHLKRLRAAVTTCFPFFVAKAFALHLTAACTVLSSIHQAEPELAIVNKAEVPFASTGPRVFFGITIGGVKAGQIIVELFSDVVPITTENFKALCIGEKGKAPNGKPLYYKNSSFHKVILGWFCAAITKPNTGGESTFGGKFTDENFREKHKGFAVLFMANGEERDNNCSRFSIRLNKEPGFSGWYVVFRGVVEGLDVVRAIQCRLVLRQGPQARSHCRLRPALKT
ncbi:hypothetical protein AMTRI_Chr09g21080 [Amborella trichopoda]